MQIQELVARTGVSAKTIRYYESINLLPPPGRLANGYRQYGDTDIDRVKLVAGARRLDIPLAEIKEILDLRDHNQAPCRVMLDLLQQKAAEVHQRIAELQTLEAELKALHALGKTFSLDDVEGKNCICHLVSQHASAASN
ncbi:MAG: heavy metal-responsive transcriptional regulator [Anaerolineae bacterium]|nr:heavy metal-responsive transcriptional regulator [Anaerolineae bacterium]